MVRTAQEHPVTKERLLDAAERLMLAKGYAATVDDICKAAKLTKGSFFHYFESKEALGKELLQRFCSRMGERILEAVGSQRDPLKRVYAFLDFTIAMARECGDEPGCLLGTFAQELSDTNPAMRDQCAKEFARWAGRLAQDLEEAKAAYAPKAPIEAQGLAYHIIATLEGSKILAKARRDARMEEQNLLHLKRYLNALFGK